MPVATSEFANENGQPANGHNENGGVNQPKSSSHHKKHKVSTFFFLHLFIFLSVLKKYFFLWKISRIITQYRSENLKKFQAKKLVKSNKYKSISRSIFWIFSIKIEILLSENGKYHKRFHEIDLFDFTSYWFFQDFSSLCMITT